MSGAPDTKHEPGITFNPNIPDFTKSASAIKKAEKARAFIAKNGLPEDKRPKKGK